MIYYFSSSCPRLKPKERLLLTTDIHDYPFVSQGKTEIANVDDGEELRMTDVSTKDEKKKSSSSSCPLPIRDIESRIHFTCPPPIQINNFWP